MVGRNVSARIHDMLSAIQAIEDMGDLSVEDLPFLSIKSLALERAIEIISEASRHIPDDLKATQDEIPWPQIAGIGNILRHDYQGVRGEIMLNVVKNDLQPLKAALLAIQRRLLTSLTPPGA